MENFNQIRDLWNSVPATVTSSLSNQDVQKVIGKRIVKEKKILAEYFWVAFVFQLLLYSFGCYVIAKYWNDSSISLPAAAGILMYIPLTVVLMQKFKAMLNAPPYPAVDIRSGLSIQRKLLQSYFIFKKRFDLISIPVNSFILIVILFKLYVPGSIEQNVFWGLVFFVLLMLIYATAAWFENRKHFIQPLKHFDIILRDIDDEKVSKSE